MSRRSSGSPASSLRIRSIARCTSSVGAASLMSPRRCPIRARVFSSLPIGSCRPLMPRGPHSIPQMPIGVSNRAKCWSVMVRSSVQIYLLARNLGLEIVAIHPISASQYIGTSNSPHWKRQRQVLSSSPSNNMGTAQRNARGTAMKLTQQQIDNFNREGWLFLPELFNAEEVALLAREAVGIYDANRPEVWREKSGAPRTAFAAHLYNEAFRLLGAHPRMIDPIEQVFGEKVYMHQFKINAKAAFTGDVWQWHQDYGTWKRDDGMPEPRAMNIAIFLDEVMPINGPLMLVPRSQLDGDIKATHNIQKP